MTKYKAIAGHWNGACYSTDGETWCYYDSLDEAISAADGLVDIYSTDGDGDDCDVDIEWSIYDCSLDDYDPPVATIHVSSQSGERAQDACTALASHEDEWTTSYFGVGPAGELVVWTNNGGTQGAHDRMDGSKGEWVERYDAPTMIDAVEWVRLGLEYGLAITDLLEHVDLSLYDSDSATWLQADDLGISDEDYRLAIADSVSCGQAEGHICVGEHRVYAAE